MARHRASPHANLPEIFENLGRLLLVKLLPSLMFAQAPQQAGNARWHGERGEERWVQR